MIDTQSTGPDRTRPYTTPEVYRAIAHALSRPQLHLVEPTRIRRCQPEFAHMPTVDLVLEDGKLAGILGWAKAMDPIGTVNLVGVDRDSVYLMLSGRLPAGPTVSVVSWVDDMPLEVRVFGGQPIPYDDLVALAAGTTTLSVPALVGAR